MSDESSMVIKKKYEYPRIYIDDKGNQKTYVQSVTRIVKQPDLEKMFNKKLNEILFSTTRLNKLNRIKNSIIRNKCYGKANFIKQINKIDYVGELTEETRELINEIYKQQYEVADDIEKSLKILLDLYKAEQKRIKEFNDELRVLDESGTSEGIKAT